MQQHVGRPGRAHAQECADNAGGRHRRLEHIRLKPLIEKINGAHGHELHLVVLVLARHCLEAPADEQKLHQLAWVQRVRVRRHHAENRFYEPAHRLHRFAEFVVGFRVHAGVARNLAVRLAMIVHAPQVVAAGHGRERTVEWKNLQAMAGKIEVANNLRPQQRDHVGADRKLEPLNDLFRASRSPEHVATLEHQHFLAGAREISGIDQPVVASADDDGVVLRFDRGFGRA